MCVCLCLFFYVLCVCIEARFQYGDAHGVLIGRICTHTLVGNTHIRLEEFILCTIVHDMIDNHNMIYD